MSGTNTVALHPYAAFLHEVTKPARYTGGEVGSVEKPWTDDVAKVCLAFPDVYDIGMSHLGFKILYRILNDHPRTLAERCYAPWVDLEAKLRERGLPLVSLESKRPLRDFDVVGFSLQFELTYTNVLTMLDLGGIPLRAADRGEADPLVLAGGPNATHPEPVAPFLDAIVLGDGEEKATEIALLWKSLRDSGVPRRERLVAIAKLGSVYVPSLYETEVDADTGIAVVVAPKDATIPFPIQRALVDLAKFPFPDESPTGGPEAIFDRMSIEIARGCTEGCRFCQAGMIYRPVRERDPEEIVETVVRAVKKSGQDEVSLTALSTADVSCISPLIKKVTARLAEEGRISLGVSSLRAYGLDPDLLDELRQVRATGLTFAPEAGTQRMRDVINKNVTEEQLMETAERVFSRGWGKMKLYFICGLPTETDEDVEGIIETGIRALDVGKRAVARGKPAEVTVSVSVHVPKPHTPFQWCAMDSLETIAHKQWILRDRSRHVRGLKLKTHDAEASVIEGIIARGDRRLADVIEDAWRAGARFDSWDDHFELGRWVDALVRFGIEPERYLGTLPITARLPWSHLDVGLEDGFLAREYRKAVASRLSPPCGKVAGAFVHATNVAEAQAEGRKLVCYDCGVACDMTQMREERLVMLRKLGALEPKKVALAAVAQSDAEPDEVDAAGDVVATDEGGFEAEAAIDEGEPVVRAARVRLEEGPVDPSTLPRGHKPPGRADGTRYRIAFEKVGPVALLGHLDLIRELPRMFRRLGVRLAYTRGFHPKPDMVFGPALGLGASSLEEVIDLRLAADLSDEELAALPTRMTAAAPKGLIVRRIQRLVDADPPVSKVVSGARWAIVFARRAFEELAGEPADGVLARRTAEALAATSLPVRREATPEPGRALTGLGKMIEVRKYLVDARPLGDEGRAAVARAGLVGDVVGFEVIVRITSDGAARPVELAEALLGPLAERARPGAPLVTPHQIVRLAITSGDPLLGGSTFDLDAARVDASRAREARKAAAAEAAAVAAVAAAGAAE